MALGLTVQEIIESREFPLLRKHESWLRVPLSYVASVQNGYAFSSDRFTKGEGMPLIRIRDISNSHTQDFYQGDYSKEFVVNTGDILIGMDGDFNLSRWKGGEALLNQRVCRLKTITTLYSEKFLVHTLPTFLNAINAKTSSVTVKHLSSRTIEEILLPLPPLAEQQRIVAKIEELFSELDKGVEMLKTAQQQLKVYRQAVLKNAFDGRLTNPDIKDGELPEGWVLNTISDVCDMKAGFFIKASEISEMKKEGFFPCYGGNGLRGYVKIYTHQGKFPIVGRQGALCGNVHLVDGTFYATEHAVVVTAKKNIDVNWLYHKLRYMKLNKYSTGTAQPGLSVNKLLQLSIEIPTINEQLAIVQEIESRLSVCDKIEESIEQGLHQAEALRQSILKKAFEGKLVPQDPTDEPASVLIERIRADRAASFSEKKKTTTKKAKVK